METKPLTSVHEALNNAVFADAPKKIKMLSFRLEDELADEIFDICERHGTTLSEFLRQCCMGLANDYRDPSRG